MNILPVGESKLEVVVNKAKFTDRLVNILPGESKLEVVVVKAKCLEQGLAKQPTQVHNGQYR